MKHLPTVSIDYETYYSQEYSIRKMSPWNYVFNPEFDAYLVAVHGDGIHWVGHPSKFNWYSIANFRWVYHNGNFDGLIVRKAWADGVIPTEVVPLEEFDTADMVAYLRVKRDLATASRLLLNRTLNKGMRNRMKGLHYRDAVAKGWEKELIAYGGEDAEVTYLLFEKYAHLWPDNEQEISRLTREAGWKGMPVDVEGVNKDYANLSQRVVEALRLIPWTDSGEKPLSVEMARRQARIDGLEEMPASLAATDDDANAWIEKYSEEFPWVSAIREYRRVNILCEKVKALKDGVRPDGTFPYSIKYFGTNTGRSSGGGEASAGGKFNMLNMPKYEMFGVNVRNKFIAAPKRKLLIIDYGQIEARLLLWKAGDQQTIERIRGGLNLYEAKAMDLLGSADVKGLKERDPATYGMVKATTLGAGYAMGGARFVIQAPVLTRGAYRPTEEEAFKAIYAFRDANPLIVRHWAMRQAGLLSSIRMKDTTHRVQLPCGYRWLTYFDPHLIMVEDLEKKKMRAEARAMPIRGEAATNIYGGKITENEIQAASRDLLCDGLLGITHKLGLHVYFTLYDEFVIDVPADGAEEAAKEVTQLLQTSSPWASGLPLSFDVKIADCYAK